MKTIKLGLAVIVIAAVLVFAIQNLETVTLGFLIWDIRLPFGIAIIIAFVLGGFAARPILRFLNNQRRERARDKQVEDAVAKKAAR